jgi:signal transduction histidine kinase
LWTYTNLNPGTYTFRVKGSNNDGVWNPRGRTIRLVILPPWWRTWWAYAAYALAGAALLYGLYHYLITRERLRNELQLERLETDKLQEMDQVKTRFFTNISHEFRTPLTLILGPLENRLASEPYPHRKEDQRMYRNAQRLLQLINQLLDISKLEAGRVKMQSAEMDLVRHVQAIVFSFTSLAETRQIILGFGADCEKIPVYADRNKLEKIVSNLLSNAFKFTPEGGQINVHLSVTGEGPHGAARDGEVQDSGIGIPPDRLGRIFDRRTSTNCSEA